MFTVAKSKPDSELLKVLAKAKHEVHFSSGIELCRLDQQREDVEKFAWTGRLSPSNPTIQFDMCMDDLEESLLKPVQFQASTLTRVKWGIALHEGLAKEILKYENSLLYSKPVIKNNPKKAAQLKYIWPEIPVWNEILGFSGKADCVMRLRNLPAPLDFKTKWIESENWEADKDEQGKPLPYDYWIAQVAAYGVCILENDMYEGVIPEQLGLVVFNLLRKPESKDFCKEYWFPFNEELILKTKLMMAYCGHRRAMMLNNIEPRQCNYPLCPTHGKGIQMQGVNGQLYSFTPRVKRKPETSNAPKANTTANFMKQLKEEQRCQPA